MVNVVSVSDDAPFLGLPARGWLKRHEHPVRSVLLLLAGAIAVTAGLMGAARRVGEFQRLDFRSVTAPEGLLIVEVSPRSGAARAGLAWGDVILALDGEPVVEPQELEHRLFARRITTLTVVGKGVQREVAYYPPAPSVDIQYLLVAFVSMFTLAVAGLVFLAHPATQSARFLLLAEALFAGLVVPFPQQADATWQILLLVRDFGRLALPPLLVAFFATFPTPQPRSGWLWLAFVPSVAVAVGRTSLTAGALPPILGDIYIPDFLQRVTAALAVVGILGAAVLGIWAYVSNRDNPTRRRQVEWVALGAAAGFAPYLLLSIVPSLAGADLELLTWVALLPLALVPLGVASSLLEYRLWDLEDITRQVAATGLAVLLGGVSFALLNYAISQFGFRLGNWRNLIAVAGGVLLATLTVPVRRMLLEGLEYLQYRERLVARRALTTFAEEAASHREPETLLARLGQLLREALAVDGVVTYLAFGDRLYPSPSGERWPTLSVEDLRGPFPAAAERPLLDAGLFHRFGMERDGRVIGVVYCGHRHGELPLGHGERRLVAALTAQAALALENSVLLANLRRQVQEHRLLEDYLERVFQSSAAALMICDATGRILRANERLGAVLGRASAELAGEKLAAVVELDARFADHLPPDLDGVQVRFTVSGEPRTGLVSTSVLEVEPGRFDGRVVALDDISEQLRMEQRLARQERLASLGRLAAGLAHEVNTPVTGIASYAQLLRDLTASEDPRAPILAKIEEQAFRVARIVSNLLELARPSGFERQPVSLAEVLRDEVVLLRPDTDRARVSILFVAKSDSVVDGNRVQLELVAHNLLRNAIQASAVGDVVEVEVTETDSMASFEVRDSGPGVPEELEEQIFEPFVTTRQGQGGTGLGLAISRDIVKAHGGSIVVRRREGRGTVMRIEIPRKGERK